MINLKIIFFILGVLVSVLSLSMIIPLALNFFVYGSFYVFFSSFLISSFFGFSLILAFRNNDKKIGVNDTIIVTVLSLPVLCFFASLPFYFDHNILKFSDAFFEATSGLTTTGASIYDNVENLSLGLLVWRSLIQWLGGIGIIIFAIAILPILNIGGMQLFTQDWKEKDFDLHYRSKELAKLVGIVYLSFTFFIFLCLWFLGMPAFQAFCHSLTTVATGGFSTNNNSIAHYNSLPIELTIIIGMILASLPFTLYLSTFKKGIQAFKDAQVFIFLILILFFTLALSSWNYFQSNLNFFVSLRIALFNGVSVITGTGYSTANFSSWGSFPSALLLIMMLIGGCTGSTTGGIKIFRIQLLYFVLIKELKKINSPRSVFSSNYKNQVINDDIINSVMVIILLFLGGIFVISLIFYMYGYDFITSVSAAITSICVVGPGLGNIIGPEESFYTLPSNLKIILSGAMIMGRLEFIAFFVLLLPSFWRQK
ncbi:MAG: Trk system potassium uptake protein TrkI [Alphaproteobacteria bacterium MarineAlpha9_Bin4]|nr:potassium transporter TrkH [Pelagibacterales bacterium]PPR27414.1 MAG: Trk system potassium uptake protein TrkI [Alphaproteobacteria bacterium MarineAlpha9_Bin4]|tara:strand:+ start:27 stop:1472 length:1446 start_codon:yes stop_codon:yes gene_type:complete